MTDRGDGGYAAAHESAAFAELDRGLLEARGPKRLEFLQGMLSNDLAPLRPGQGCRAALLDVKGHVQALMRVLVSEEAVALEMPKARLGLVEGFLNRHKVAAPVRLRPEDAVVVAVLGPAAREVLARLGAAIGDLSPESHVTTAMGGSTVRVAAAGDFPARGLSLHAEPGAREALAAALLDAGAAPLAPGAMDALRVEEGRPWFGRDVSEENLLHETGQIGEYASFSKGCYIGQEVVARLDARGGHVNKALRGLRLDAPTLGGARLRADDKDVGHVTTAAVSPRHGPIAFAYVHRSHFEPGTVLDAEGTRAIVAALPFVGR